jgi:excisionase family DNA binding protein/PAS domain S-box-containing protein
LNYLLIVCRSIVGGSSVASEAREKNLLTVKDVAAYLQVNQTTIYRLLRRAEIPAFKLGGDWRFNLESIDAWRLAADTGVSRAHETLHTAQRAAPRTRGHARGPWQSRSAAAQMPAALAQLYQAISRRIAPLGELHAMVPVIKRIAEAVEDRRDSSEEIARLYEGQAIPFRAQTTKLFEFAPMAFAVIDSECRAVSFNAAYCSLLGISAKQLRSVVITDLVTDTDRDSAVEAHRQLLAGKAQSNTFVGRLTVEGAPIVVRSRAWVVRRSPSDRAEYVADVLDRAATSDEASGLFAQSADEFSKRRETLLRRRG